jgi:hypothetical protein
MHLAKQESLNGVTNSPVKNVIKRSNTRSHPADTKKGRAASPYATPTLPPSWRQPLQHAAGPAVQK